MYVAAILPPNNAEIPLLAVKRNLFKDYSALSSWALKPMIPFAFFRSQPESLKRKDLPELPDGGLAVNLPSVMAEQYVLGSKSCSVFCTRLEALFSTCDGFISGLKGLQLFDTRDTGVSNINTVRKYVDNQLAELDSGVFVWKSCALGIFRIETELFSSDNWWTRVIISNGYEIRFPKSLK